MRDHQRLGQCFGRCHSGGHKALLHYQDISHRVYSLMLEMRIQNIAKLHVRYLERPRTKGVSATIMEKLMLEFGGSIVHLKSSELNSSSS